MAENTDHNKKDFIKQQWQLLLVAVMFYTRLPVPKNLPHSEQILNDSRVYFPAIGIAIGGLSALGFVLISTVLPLNICVALSMVISILATGAFHEDGFADSCDGLGGGWSKEQVLTIMKDSRIGTYACVGLMLLLTVKFLTLWEIAKIDLLLFCVVIVFSHTASRLLASVVIEFYDYVQDIDKSKIKPITNQKFGSNQWRISLAITVFSALLVIAVRFDLLFATIIAFIGAVLISWRFCEYCQTRIGGYTGDTLGATQQISEITIYLLILCFLK